MLQVDGIAFALCTAVVLLVAWKLRSKRDASGPFGWARIQMELYSTIYKAEKRRAEYVSQFVPDYQFMKSNPRFSETAEQLRTLFERQIQKLDEETVEKLIELESRAAAAGASRELADLIGKLSLNNPALRSALAARAA